ncbi:hypothetical protein B0T19DRAFT_432766 [Cercophora scortea]|uniref:Glycosyl transferase CAP10 domain-containing protein n=1 Tax=Cercophora scortea TaxID=314031 RepID=A0AAE0M5D8_9PEZI|nr:hypothetical protein B0T19DRAFT_432766 [Cercophora scortea]
MYRAWQRYAALAALIVLITIALLRERISQTYDQSSPTWLHRDPPLKPGQKGPGSDAAGLNKANTDAHPIDTLIREARFSFKQLLGKQSVSIEQAAARYRERRGRHPPPGFDAWFAAAQKNKAIVVEEFFDRIHHDINPLWGLDPAVMRKQTHGQKEVIRVRNGRVTFDGDRRDKLSFRQRFHEWMFPDDRRPPKIQLWAELVEEALPHIPDLDMAMNTMDETRVLVPWENITALIETEAKTRTLIDPSLAISTYSGFADVDAKNEPYEINWIRGEAGKYWDHMRVSCPPDSPARNITSLEKFDLPLDYPTAPEPAFTYHGYIRNFSMSQDACTQPHIRDIHGTFVESVSMATTHEFLPMFAETKLMPNNEMLIPAAAYLSSDTMYSGGHKHGGPWSTKKDALVWRGVASGGRNKIDNWTHFQRHRFVQMMNGTTVSAVERGEAARAPTFALAPVDVYNITAQRNGQLGSWVSTFADVGMTHLLCTPELKGPDGKKIKTCDYTSPFMALANNVPMEEQYSYKYLPDVDGNSFSGRYRGFLRSTSMTLKSTIYAEWHDSRLFPWVHFAPFDNSFMDIYAVMDYFLNGHDAEAARIAAESREWAESVIRREDMMLYTWRLLLEYARVVDDRREALAFVDDLRD